MPYKSTLTQHYFVIASQHPQRRLSHTQLKTMGNPYPLNDPLRAVHLEALRKEKERVGKVNVSRYVREWNSRCSQGEELSENNRKLLNAWLVGGNGSSYAGPSQTKAALQSRRRRARKSEGENAVTQTSETFYMD